jgi:hypothetical protein
VYKDAAIPGWQNSILVPSLNRSLPCSTIYRSRYCRLFCRRGKI